MGYPGYIVTNLAKVAVITGANVSGSFPLTNLVDDVLGSIARFTGGGGTMHFNVDASPFVNYDSLFIGNHNMAIASESFQVQVDDTLIPSGSAISVWRKGDTFIDLNVDPLGRNKSYVHVTLASSRDPIEVGEVVIGTRVLLPRGPRLPGMQKTQTNTGITTQTISGITSDIEFTKFTNLEATFKFPESEYQDFLDFSDAVGRDVFVFIPEVDSTFALLGKKVDRGFNPRTVEIEGSGEAWYEWVFKFRSESKGLSL